MQTVAEVLGVERRIAHNRLAKCTKIVHRIVDDSVRILEALSQEEWQNLAAQVGVNEPSQESQKMVIQMVKNFKGTPQ